MPPDYPADFGFVGAKERVKEIGEAFRLYKMLPHAGGFMDQSEADRHDIATYMNGIAYFQYEHGLTKGNGKA